VFGLDLPTNIRWMCYELTCFCSATRNVSTRPSVVSRTVTLQMNSSSTKFYTISYTFSTTCFLHLRLLHSLTTSVEDRIVSYFLNVLDTSWILTLLFACYTKTFIDDIIPTIYILLKGKLIILLYIFQPTPCI